jgi:hypothetical protein
MTVRGGCLCGAVRYELSGRLPEDVAHCHCRICQRSCGAAFVTWATVPAASFAYTQGTPGRYRSSAEAQREFCPACGTQLVFRADGDDVDITVASLDEPDALKPAANIWVTSRRAWMHGFDSGLPDFAAEFGLPQAG